MEKKILYISGAGKCGTHIISAWIHENCADAEVYLKELKTWRAGIDQETDKNFIVFHCPGVKYDTFRTLFPNGVSLSVLRNPIQNYLSWVRTQYYNVYEHNTFNVEKGWNKNWDLNENNTIFHNSLLKVVQSFLNAKNADLIWHLEDFTSNEKQRKSLAANILPIKKNELMEHIHLPKKSMSVPNDQIYPIKEDLYKDQLTSFEIDALIAHDRVFSIYYPDWKAQLNRKTQSQDIEILNSRYNDLVPMAISRHIKKYVYKLDNKRLPIIKSAKIRAKIFKDQFLSRQIAFSKFWTNRHKMDAEIRDLQKQFSVFSTSIN